MQKISYARYGFQPVLILHVVSLYFWFPLSYRDVEDLLAERGIDVSYETVRRWALKFGQAYARRLRTTHPPLTPSGTLMRCSCPSLASGCIYGALSIVKAKCWILWVGRAETKRQRFVSIDRKLYYITKARQNLHRRVARGVTSMLGEIIGESRSAGNAL